MTRMQQKAQGRTKQVVGKMIGDDKLVVEGKEEERQAEATQTADDKGAPDEERKGERRK